MGIFLRPTWARTRDLLFRKLSVESVAYFVEKNKKASHFYEALSLLVVPPGLVPKAFGTGNTRL